MTGFELCERLEREPELVDVPVVFVSAHLDEEFEIAGFRAGAADFITKPFNPRLVLERVRAQLRFKRMSDQLRTLATIDALTGVANRRRLEEALASEWRRARRSRTPMSVGLIDVDHFKSYNDHYGHGPGDACLRVIAQQLARACLRPADLVARYGGEEFAVLLPETPAAGAAHVARRLVDGIAALRLPHAASPTSAHVSVSVGMASYQPAQASGSEGGAELSVNSLLDAADAALYAAKRAGRARAQLVELDELMRPKPVSVPLPAPTVVESS